MSDYKDRQYLSSTEGAKYLGISVSELHSLTNASEIACQIAASGQKRFDLQDLRNYKERSLHSQKGTKTEIPTENILDINATTQKVLVKNAMDMVEVGNESIHLMVTSPPYFDAKMYSDKPIEGNLGNIHDLDEWFKKIAIVWKEVFRTLQPGRKCFINIMNLPVRDEGGFKSLNLVGRTVEEMEKI